MRREYDGQIGWGEDQDGWRLDHSQQMLRALRTSGHILSATRRARAASASASATASGARQRSKPRTITPLSSTKCANASPDDATSPPPLGP
jgi:hypothetical protein